MSIIWTIKDLLQSNDINNATSLKRRLEEELGLSVSRQSLHRLINNNPQYIRVDTLQILCNLLQVNSDQFFKVLTEPKIKPSSEIIKLYSKIPVSDISASNPSNFLK